MAGKPLSADEIRNRVKEVRKVRFGDVAPNPRNPRKHPDNQREAFRGAVREIGFASVPVAYHSERAGGALVWADGHLRGSEAASYEGEVAILDITDAEADMLLVTADPIAYLAQTDAVALEALLRDVQTSDIALNKMLADMAEEAGIGKKAAGADTEPQIDKAEELRQKWGVSPGDLWALGEHRLICGDCTDKATVERVMGGERAVLCHADPPYGMGKEKDGIANDNLYREKLDAFQMQWWNAARPSLVDNGSVYIWGNAEDLWRFWYCGGLRDSERLTLRNEIVWDKGHGQGMESDAHRMYPTASERCLFFMLGEQGFNNNADNYWDGWEPIRAYLKEQRDLIGWDNAKCKALAGHSPKSGCHWFDASQWSFVTEDVYRAWQVDAKGRAFQRDYDELKRDYDELKRDFYATRAYFDNTHDNMTDVWKFERVTGDERHGHATPKLTNMIARVITTSAAPGDIVLVPFAGTLPEIIACENLSRRCRAIEISPGYVAVALERWHQHTARQPERVE